jgi:hypothetical protein
MPGALLDHISGSGALNCELCLDQRGKIERSHELEQSVRDMVKNTKFALSTVRNTLEIHAAMKKLLYNEQKNSKIMYKEINDELISSFKLILS